MLINIKDQQLTDLEKNIKKKMSSNQSFYSINKMWNNDIYEKPRDFEDKEFGRIVIDLNPPMKKEVILYKEYDKNEWNDLWLNIIKIFHDYPISRYV